MKWGRRAINVCLAIHVFRVETTRKGIFYFEGIKIFGKIGGKVNVQEIYLLERYISIEYFRELRDTWEGMIKHLEGCLDLYMKNLPAEYRSKPLPEQPDIVWGHRVLPNFRDSLQSLITGYILLTHGDFNALYSAWGPFGDFKGQMDYSSSWLSPEDENLYRTLLHESLVLADNICKTEGAYWKPGRLANHSDNLGPLNPPAQWPVYGINRDISVATGAKTLKNGIYMPDVENSCPQFLSLRHEKAPPAFVCVGIKELLHPTTGEKYGEQAIFGKQSCTWFLVERVSDGPSMPLTHADGIKSHRIAAGDPCPETGYYFTPARPDSRRLFQQGDVMPDFETTYGKTIWQWDAVQQ